MHKVKAPILATGFALGMSVLSPNLANAESLGSKNADKAALIAAQGLTNKIKSGKPIPINGNEQLVWSEPKSPYRFQYDTNVVVDEKINNKQTFFKLEVIGKDIIAKPIPYNDFSMEIESPIADQLEHLPNTIPLKVVSESAVVKLVDSIPTAEVELNNGKVINTEVGKTNIINQQVITN